MDLLSKKIAQMEKELTDLASKNATLQARILGPSHLKAVPPKNEEARNSQIGSRVKKDKMLNQNQEDSLPLSSQKKEKGEEK